MNLGFLVFILPETADLITQGNGNIFQNMSPEQQIVYYGSGKEEKEEKN